MQCAEIPPRAGTLAEFGGMSINPTQPIPIYYQLKTLLLEEILSGRYGPEARLPTEHELCKQHAISRTPVSRALSELAEEISPRPLGHDDANLRLIRPPGDPVRIDDGSPPPVPEDDALLREL